MEFLSGIACLLFGLGTALFAARHGGRAIDRALQAGVVVEVLVIATLFLDWGYDWYDVTAFQLALNRSVWVVTPHVLAVLSLMALWLWGRRAVPRVLVLVVVQAASVAPILYIVSETAEQSLLAAAPVVALYGSVLAAFLFLPATFDRVPSPGSRWYAITMAPRGALIDAIQALAADGLVVAAPGTVFESGSAHGRLGAGEVVVSTEPTVLPLRYALRVRVACAAATSGDAAIGDAAGREPGLPGFAPKETLHRGVGGLEYLGVTDGGFSVTAEGLRAFVKRLTSDGQGIRP